MVCETQVSGTSCGVCPTYRPDRSPRLGLSTSYNGRYTPGLVSRLHGPRPPDVSSTLGKGTLVPELCVQRLGLERVTEINDSRGRD